MVAFIGAVVIGIILPAFAISGGVVWGNYYRESRRSKIRRTLIWGTVLSIAMLIAFLLV